MRSELRQGRARGRPFTSGDFEIGNPHGPGTLVDVQLEDRGWSARLQLELP